MHCRFNQIISQELNKGNRRVKLHRPGLSFLGKITPTITLKKSQRIIWRNKIHLRYTRKFSGVNLGNGNGVFQTAFLRYRKPSPPQPFPNPLSNPSPTPPQPFPNPSPTLPQPLSNPPCQPPPQNQVTKNPFEKPHQCTLELIVKSQWLLASNEGRKSNETCKESKDRALSH